MKLHILSDLHVEFGDFVIPDVSADIVILAGDTHVGTRGVRWALDQKTEVPVIYVLGNHEFYQNKFPGLIDDLKREAEGTHVHVLENDVFELGGFRFFGCTLWSDMALFGDVSTAMAAPDLVVIVHATIGDSHGRGYVAEKRHVAPQRTAEETEAAELEDIVFENVT